MATSLLGYWNFDDGLLDKSSNGILTTASNVGIIGGKFARAGFYDGVNSHVRVADNQALKFGDGNFSISAWIKPTVGGTFDFVINKRGTGPFGNHPGVLLVITDQNGGWAISVLVDDGLGNKTQCEGCGATYPYNAWYQIAMVYEGNDLKFYVNGQPDNTVAGSNVGSINNSFPMLFGGNIIHSGA